MAEAGSHKPDDQSGTTFVKPASAETPHLVMESLVERWFDPPPPFCDFHLPVSTLGPSAPSSNHSFNSID